MEVAWSFGATIAARIDRAEISATIPMIVVPAD